MKKITLIALALVCGVAFMNCDAKKTSKKQKAEAAAQEDPDVAALKKQIELQKLQNELAAEQAKGATLELPCSEFQDDADFFREVGVGTSANLQSARTAALEAAKSMIKQKMAEFVQGFTSSYFNDYAGSKATDDVQRKVERKMNSVVEGMLNTASKVCESNRINSRGAYEDFYAIEIPKKDMKKNIVDALSEDEKLGIDFKEALFEEKMDEYMNKMLEDKRKAGY